MSTSKLSSRRWTYHDVEKLFRHHGLIPASRRSFPLFTKSCIGLTYCELLDKTFGASYVAIAALGDGDHFFSLYNEPLVADQTQRLIKRFGRRVLAETIDRADAMMADILPSIKHFLNPIKRDPWTAMASIIDFYPKYLTAVGAYNLFWRWLGNLEYKKPFSQKDIADITRRRDVITKWYPLCEKAMVVACKTIGRQLGVDGRSLQFLTISEMKVFLKKKTISARQQKELQQRRHGYVYMFVQHAGEVVLTEPRIVAGVQKNFFDVSFSSTTIIGHPAHPGRVTGIVYNLETKNKPPSKSGFILVASQTHPEYMSLIKKAAAVVTDEGGILSHAAIVCRELKKPCIIAAKIASRVLRDGDRVEVDATKGIVKKLS